MDVGTFAIERLIIHEIPQANLGDKTATPPRLSEAVTELEADQRLYFERRIKTSMQKAFEVVWDDSTDSPVPPSIMTCFDAKSDEAQFVEQSRLMAIHLHSKQKGGSPSGLLVVAEGTIGGASKFNRVIVVLKLELEAGVSVDPILTNGKATLRVKIENVTLTESTRVFKAGMFNRFDNLQDMAGWVSDAQLDSATAGRLIADFFLADFLGCELKDSPSVATMRFVATANNFMNSLDNEDKKFRYTTAVRAELESQNPTIHPETLANRAFDVADRDNFINRFKQPDGKVQPIMKNTELIEREIGRTWVTFDDGARLTGPPDVVKRYVQAIRSATDEQGEKIVHSEIKQVR